MLRLLRLCLARPRRSPRSQSRTRILMLWAAPGTPQARKDNERRTPSLARRCQEAERHLKLLGMQSQLGSRCRSSGVGKVCRGRHAVTGWSRASISLYGAESAVRGEESSTVPERDDDGRGAPSSSPWFAGAPASTPFSGV
jgi:hypothetical protein